MPIKARARDRRSGADVAFNAARILKADFVADVVFVEKVNRSTIQQDQQIIFGSELKAICASVIAQGRGKPKRKEK